MSTYIFDNIQKIEQIDQSKMVNLLYHLAEQCEEAIAIGKKAKLAETKNIANILFAGLGGSAIGGDLLRNYLADALRVPFVVSRNYTLPNFVDTSTLFIASSYSGNTEETVSAYDGAKKKKARILCITSGGKLADRAKQDGFPVIIIPPGLPPRTAIGYSFFPALIALHQLGLIPDKREVDETRLFREAQEVIGLLKKLREQYTPSVAIEQNMAKQIASRLYSKLPVVYASGDRFESVVTRWRCQFNENSKCLANSQVFPELNHNEVVGWEGLKDLMNRMHVIYLRDKEDHPQVQKRFQITKELIHHYADGITEVWTVGNSLLARLWSVIYLGDFVSYYLAILNEVDPTPVKKINYLKEKLTQNKENSECSE
ncbi:MAG: bifunctional phosphoglucose/phosphomannose isomerase [bacterium]|nr:bifunctional phosphoglucose/phosphomannose isomerase [bacterium]